LQRIRNTDSGLSSSGQDEIATRNIFNNIKRVKEPFSLPRKREYARLEDGPRILRT
jgi:hypothetical protein